MVLRVKVEVATIVVFKRILDRHVNVHGMEDYGSCAGGD